MCAKQMFVIFLTGKIFAKNSDKVLVPGGESDASAPVTVSEDHQVLVFEVLLLLWVLHQFLTANIFMSLNKIQKSALHFVGIIHSWHLNCCLIFCLCIPLLT